MRVIGGPSGTVLSQGEAPIPDAGPYMAGGGDTTWLCGKCDFPLAVSINPADVQGTVLHCPKCGAYNDRPAAGGAGLSSPLNRATRRHKKRQR